MTLLATTHEPPSRHDYSMIKGLAELLLLLLLLVLLLLLLLPLRVDGLDLRVLGLGALGLRPRVLGYWALRVPVLRVELLNFKPHDSPPWRSSGWLLGLQLCGFLYEL